MSVMKRYYIKTCLEIGEGKYRYLLLWVDKFVDYLLNTFALISINLIKREMKKYYKNHIEKHLRKRA